MYFWQDLLFLTGLLALVMPAFAMFMYENIRKDSSKKKAIITTSITTASIFVFANLLYIFTYFLQFTY